MDTANGKSPDRATIAEANRAEPSPRKRTESGQQKAQKKHEKVSPNSRHRAKQSATNFNLEALAEFTNANPGCEIVAIPGGFRVMRPWGDESLILEGTGSTADALVRTLNRVMLPSRFTAIYHRASNEMEFIAGYQRLDSPLLDRKFTFALEANVVQCEFRPASEDLSVLVETMRPAGLSKTDYRNLLPIKQFTDAPQALRERYSEKPISFWISPVSITDDEAVTKLAKHINFYMRYYDRRSTSIIIHETPSTQSPPTTLPLLKPAFPEEIRVRDIDNLLLDFALAATSMTEPRLKFIYYYQILEYAAFYTVGERTKHDLSTILLSPDLQANLSDYIPKILDLLTDVRMGDDQKFERLIQERALPEHAWPEIEANKNFFTCTHRFDGGFELEPLISADTSLEGFKTMWGTKVPSILRRVRNALVHGREARTNAVIAPSPENEMRLAPLIPVIRRVAEDVIIYSD